MKTYFLLLLFLCSIQLHAQLAVGTVLHLDNGTPGMRKETVLLDTLINGKMYKKCEAIEHGQSSIFYYLLDNQKLYRMDDQFQHWKKLYDFTKQPGDTFVVDTDSILGYGYFINSINTNNSLGFSQNSMECVKVGNSYFNMSLYTPFQDQNYYYNSIHNICEMSIFDSLHTLCYSDANHTYSRFGVCDSSFFSYDPVFKDTLVNWGYSWYGAENQTGTIVDYICTSEKFEKNGNFYYSSNFVREEGTVIYDTLEQVYMDYSLQVNDTITLHWENSPIAFTSLNLPAINFLVFDVEFREFLGKVRKFIYLKPLNYYIGYYIFCSGIGVVSYEIHEVGAMLTGYIVNHHGTLIDIPFSLPYPYQWKDCGGGILTSKDENSENIPKLYPNPTQNILSFEGIQGSWQITDLQGKIMTAGFSDGKKENISVSDLSTGIYLFIHEQFKTKFVKE